MLGVSSVKLQLVIWISMIAFWDSFPFVHSSSKPDKVTVTLPSSRSPALVHGSQVHFNVSAAAERLVSK